MYLAEYDFFPDFAKTDLEGFLEPALHSYLLSSDNNP
jgi:hypothetical protein